MRLPLVAPSNLSPEQRELYDDMRQGIESNFKGFEAIKSDGALIGPWNPWLNYPKFGGPIWELVKVLSTSPTLPRPVREVAILVTGTHFHSGYELYAHVLIAEARGLPDSMIATIVAGQRPADLTREEEVAYDVASALVFAPTANLTGANLAGANLIRANLTGANLAGANLQFTHVIGADFTKADLNAILSALRSEAATDQASSIQPLSAHEK